MGRGYVAAVPGLLFGERTLAVGEAVPIEEGRDYTALLHRREIIEGEIRDAPAAPLRPATPPDGWADLRALDWDGLVEAAQRAGIAQPEPVAGELLEFPRSVVNLEAISTEELVELAVEFGHLVAIVVADADAQARGEDGAEKERADPLAGLVAIPEDLPTTKAPLAELCAELGLEVDGSGAGGHVLVADYVQAIEAERARRAALVAAAGES